MMYDLRVFSGSANPALADAICEYLTVQLGEINIDHFADGEVFIKIRENIRGCDVFAIQSVCNPSAENLMELLIMIDAMKRASAKRITAVLPYYGYARQDRKDQPRVAITSKLVADLLVTAGANRVLTMDLHAGQIQGFFNIPVDHLIGTPVITSYLRSRNLSDLTVVSPDQGGAVRAWEYKEWLKASDVALLYKRRYARNKVRMVELIGDVRGRDCLIVDDMIDTAGTLCEGAAFLKNNGAKDVYACCTHPVLSLTDTRDALRRITESPIKEVIITDTIPLKRTCGKIRVLSVANLFATAIRNIHNEESLSVLFEHANGK